MKPPLVSALLSLALTLPAQAQHGGFSSTEADALRRQWTLDNWDDGGPLMRYVFLNASEFWSHSLILRGGPVRLLKAAPRPEVARFMTHTDAGRKPLQDYVRDAPLNGVLVLHQGRIVYEAYPRMRSVDLHYQMSVAKVLAGTLIAILEDRGLVDSRRPIEAYLPELAGSGWRGVPVRDILDMASGIHCLDGEEGAYSNPAACAYRFEASLGWLPPVPGHSEGTRDFMAGLKSHRPPGQAYEYASVNTFVLGWLAERVTGRRYADLLSTEIWQRSGAESVALLTAPRHGVPVVHGGVASTLRDLARFGLLFTPSGRSGAKPVVSARHLDILQRQGRPALLRAAPHTGPESVDGEPIQHKGYQWDFVMKDGDFFKAGYGGQGLYVSPKRDLVIAFFGTFDAQGQGHDMTRVARQLAKSGLFGVSQTP